MALTAIKSGAQTGADQGGLDAAIELGIGVGGWVPRDRRTEAGPLTYAQMARWQLMEHSGSGYAPRTEQNVRDTDGTVIFGNPHSPGCRLTIKCCMRHSRPHLIMEDHRYSPAVLRQWVETHGIHTMNVAGNRESTNPGIYQVTFDTIVEALR